MSEGDTYRVIRSIEDLKPLMDSVPYAKYMGFSVIRDGGDVVVRLPYSDELIGNANLRAIHGGALGALMEFAAVCQLLTVSEVVRMPKVISITCEYLRATAEIDTFARATVTRCGRRIANVKAVAYQNDVSKPVATMRAHFQLAASKETEETS